MRFNINPFRKHPKAWRYLCRSCDAEHVFENTKFDEFIQSSCHDMNQRMSELQSTYRIGVNEGRYWFDHDAQEIVFSFETGRDCVAAVQNIGSWFEPRQEFLWGWDNSHLPIEQQKQSQCVFDFAERNDFIPFLGAKAIVDLSDAWHLAKLASKIVQSAGVYMIDATDSLKWFFALETPEWRASL